ncbi:MAG: hypothetical protein HQM14_15145 [SAR324 cluster bacterium]|nr:hypothetical protein [SAR324 cluster bacterium]
MIDQELLNILACPETKETVSLVEKELIEKINKKIKEGNLLNRNKEPVKENIDGGLMRADKKYLYPIREDIPVMLIEEAIPLDEFL